MEILIIGILVFLYLIVPRVSEMININEKFTGNPNDYTVKKIMLSNGNIKYQPWGKTNKNKWTSIKISNPWLDDLSMNNLFDTYEEAQEVCNRCCTQNATVTSIE